MEEEEEERCWSLTDLRWLRLPTGGWPQVASCWPADHCWAAQCPVLHTLLVYGANGFFYGANDLSTGPPRSRWLHTTLSNARKALTGPFTTPRLYLSSKGKVQLTEVGPRHAATPLIFLSTPTSIFDSCAVRHGGKI